MQPVKGDLWRSKRGRTVSELTTINMYTTSSVVGYMMEALNQPMQNVVLFMSRFNMPVAVKTLKQALQVTRGGVKKRCFFY